MYLVRLNELKYHVKHGLFPEESLVDNLFEVNLELGLEKSLSTKNNLTELIDYVFLKNTIDEIMVQKHVLLEDILGEFKEIILTKYPEANGFISIQKCPPPFGGNCKSAEVIFKF